VAEGVAPRPALRAVRPSAGPLRLLRRAPKAAAGAALLLAVLAAALLAPVLAPFPVTEMHPEARFAPPGRPYLLGTDFYGRDLLSRILWGYRTSLAVAALAVAFALLVGGTLGVVAGFAGGAVDTLIMRVMDVAFAFPVLLLAITIVVILGPGITTTVLAIGLVYVPIFARIARGPTLVVAAQAYVEAARALGQRPWRIVTRHVMPNAATPVLVQATINLATAILFESALSFLGLGTQPPYPSLGLMVSEGRNYLEVSPWPTLCPGVAIVVVVLGINLLGDALQELLDPRLRPTWTAA